MLTRLIATVIILLCAIIKVLFIEEISEVDLLILLSIRLKNAIFDVLQLAGLHGGRPVDPVILPLCNVRLSGEELLVSVSVLLTNPREHIFQCLIIYQTILSSFEIKAGSGLPFILLCFMLS